MNIICELYQIKVEQNGKEKELSPDVKIEWGGKQKENADEDDRIGGYYVTIGRKISGLQCDCNNYEKIRTKCDEIAGKIFELYDLINESNEVEK